MTLTDAAQQPWPECLRGNVVEGFSLIVYAGGSVGELVACARSADITALYALSEGEFVSYILGAPEFVTQSFRRPVRRRPSCCHATGREESGACG